MYKCKEIIELPSKGMDTSLPWTIRMEMKLHVLMCKTCSRYAKQLQFMNQVLDRYSQVSSDGRQLSASAKQRIAKQIQQAKEAVK